MLSTMIVCTALIVLFTGLPLSRNSHWMIRGLDFPRLQIAAFAALLLLAACVILDLQQTVTWLLLATITLCLGWQMWWILPYTRLWRFEVKRVGEVHSEKQISILTSNVLTPNRNADALIDLVRMHKPDVLVTLESDQWWQNKLSVLANDMPYSVKCPLDNLYGMHVFSRLVIEEAEISYLVEQDVPSIHALLVLQTGDKVRVHFLHPAPPSPTENTGSTERDAELVMVARSVADSDQPVIVAGDLNDVAWSSTTRLFRKISGLLDPRVGRGMYNTFHADHLLLRWPLDHVFHSKHFALHSITRLPSIGSDHFPLLTRLQLAPAKGANQEGLSPHVTDHARAQEISSKEYAPKNDVPTPGESNG